MLAKGRKPAIVFLVCFLEIHYWIRLLKYNGFIWEDSRKGRRERRQKNSIKQMMIYSIGY